MKHLTDEQLSRRLKGDLVHSRIERIQHDLFHLYRPVGQDGEQA